MVDDGVMVDSDGGQTHAGETLQRILCSEATSVILLQRTLCSDTSSVTLLQHILCSRDSPVILLQHKSSTGITSALSLNPPHWSRNHPPVLEAILFSKPAQCKLLNALPTSEFLEEKYVDTYASRGSPGKSSLHGCL